jgi:hypothetical protein
MTSLTNGVHTIGWFVTDSIGKADGIGSRFFTVLNDALTASGMAGSHDFPAATVNALPERAVSIAGRRGFDRDQPLRAFDAAAGEGFRAEELDRIELRLADGSEDRYSGFLRVGERLAPLPIGSSLSGGTFTWQPGAGFLGAYDFVFVRSEGSHPADRQEVRVVVHPQGTFTRPQVVVDMPSVNQRLDDGFTIGGWALDPDARSGTGVSLVQAWAYPVRGGRPVFLGTASMDGQRPDVAALYGAQFSASGFGLPVRHLAQGAYDLAVFAWSDAEGRFLPARIVRVTLR